MWISIFILSCSIEMHILSWVGCLLLSVLLIHTITSKDARTEPGRTPMLGSVRATPLMPEIEQMTAKNGNDLETKRDTSKWILKWQTVDNSDKHFPMNLISIRIFCGKIPVYYCLCHWYVQ